MDVFSPIEGKCTWWREVPNEDDAVSVRIKDSEKRVDCSCFVEGYYWTLTRGEVPSDCPHTRHCRYYIKHYR